MVSVSIEMKPILIFETVLSKILKKPDPVTSRNDRTYVRVFFVRIVIYKKMNVRQLNLRVHMGPGNYGFLPFHFLPLFWPRYLLFFEGNMI